MTTPAPAQTRRVPTSIRGTTRPDTSQRLTLTAARDANGNPVPVTGRTFSLVGYSGGRMRPRYWGDDVVVDLTGIRVPETPLPILLDHVASPGYVIGSSTDVRLADGKVFATGPVTAAGEEALLALDLADAGHPLQCSIGADELVHAYVEPGATVTVNGVAQAGPFVLVSQCVLREITVTVIGADANTSFQLAGGASPTDVPTPSVDARPGVLPLLAGGGQPRSAPVATPTPTTPADTTPAPTVPAQPLAAAANPDDVTAKIRAQAAAEYGRIAAIGKLCDVSQPGVDRAKIADIQAKAVGEGWNVHETELAVIRASRASVAPARQVEMTATNARALEASFCLRANVPAKQLEAEYGQEILNRAQSREVRASTSFAHLFNQVLMAAGQPVHFGALNNESIRAAFEAERMLKASGGVSTISMTGLLSNVQNKALVTAFLAVDDAPLKIFARDSTNDFKAVTRYRMTAVGDFEEVAKDGTIKDGTLSEETFTNQVKTYARKLGLSRQDLINDDLGAFTQIGQHYGRKAKLRIHKVGLGVLLANAGSFFHANNKNLSTGVGSVLSIAGLTAASQLFMEQTDAAGDPVMILPKYVLVAPSNAVTAKQLYNDVTVNETTTANAAKPNSNPHRGAYEPLVSPWLKTGSGLTGALNAAWYLLADPADVACVSLIFLNGNETPVIESSDLDFDMLGIAFRGYIDVGAAQADHRGGVKSAGS